MRLLEISVTNTFPPLPQTGTGAVVGWAVFGLLLVLGGVGLLLIRRHRV